MSNFIKLPSSTDKSDNPYFGCIEKFCWLDYESFQQLEVDPLEMKPLLGGTPFCSLIKISKGTFRYSKCRDFQQIKKEYEVLSEMLKPFTSELSFNEANKMVELSFKMQDNLLLIIDSYPNNIGVDFFIGSTLYLN